MGFSQHPINDAERICMTLKSASLCLGFFYIIQNGKFIRYVQLVACEKNFSITLKTIEASTSVVNLFN